MVERLFLWQCQPTKNYGQEGNCLLNEELTYKPNVEVDDPVVSIVIKVAVFFLPTVHFTLMAELGRKLCKGKVTISVTRLAIF